MFDAGLYGFALKYWLPLALGGAARHMTKTKSSGRARYKPLFICGLRVILGFYAQVLLVMPNVSDWVQIIM